MKVFTAYLLFSGVKLPGCWYRLFMSPARQLTILFTVSSAIGLSSLTADARRVSAGELKLKNGLSLEGEIIDLQGLTARTSAQSGGGYSIRMVDDGMRRYFVSRRQVQETNAAADLSLHEEFELRQNRAGRKMTPAVLGHFRKQTPFDKFGRRTVTIMTSSGPLPIVQGVTRITPSILTVDGINYIWRHAVATTSVPPETLDAIIRRATNQNEPAHRLAIARFYVDAGMFRQAAAELDAIREDFPQLAERCDLIAANLRQHRAVELLNELDLRRGAGQHMLAQRFAREFPLESIGATARRRVRELIEEYESWSTEMATVVALMSELQADVRDAELVERLQQVRTEIRSQVSMESLPKLRAFLTLADDQSLPAGDRLALACSGWILGSGNAITDLSEALNLWDARYLAVEYVRQTDERERHRILGQLSDLEGVTPDRVRRMIAHMPPLLESAGIEPGVAARVEVPRETLDDERPQAAYHVLLPHEYTPHHDYPLIISLRAAERSEAEQLLWWGGSEKNPGQAQRHGYIVISPEYLEDGATDYRNPGRTHDILVKCLRDARRRFSIDSDRVFLSGHGVGGDAAFEIGMARPDLFAGVIPVVGLTGDWCRETWKNASGTAWYIIAGELDRNSMEHNDSIVSRLLRDDTIYVEYIGRGYESYYEEIHRLFEWMSRHRRRQFPRELEMWILHPEDSEIYWISADGLRNHVAGRDKKPGLPRRASRLWARVAPGLSSMRIQSSAKSYVIGLAPDLVDFDSRLRIRVNDRARFNEFPIPRLKDMLDDFRLRGDRQMVFVMRVKV